MKKHLLKTMLTALVLLTGGVNSAWADKNVTLTQTGHITIVGKSNYDNFDVTKMYVNSYKALGGAFAVEFTLDDQFDPSKIMNATLKLHINGKPNANRTSTVTFRGQTSDPTPTSNINATKSSADGKAKIVYYGSDNTKRWAWSNTAITADSWSSYTNSYPKDNTTIEIEVTSFFKSLNGFKSGDVVWITADVNDVAADVYVDGYGSSNPAQVVITYSDVELVDYTIKYQDINGNKLKDDRTVSSISGIGVSLDMTDTQDFISGDNKWIYVSDDSEGKIVAEDGSTVVTVVFRESEKYTWTAKSSVGDYSTSGEVWEGDNAKAYYPLYLLVDGKLWTKPDNNKEFIETFAVTENNQEYTLTYNDTETDAMFLVEAENIEGATSSASANANIRCSMGLGAYFKSDTKVTTLAAGKYSVYGQVWGNSGTTFEIKAGNRQIWSKATTGYIDSETTEFVLTKETDIIIPSVGDANHVLDLIYIRSLGEPTEDELAAAAQAEQEADNLAAAKVKMGMAIDAAKELLYNPNGLSDEKINQFSGYIDTCAGLLETADAQTLVTEAAELALQTNSLKMEAQANVMKAQQNLNKLITESEIVNVEGKVGSDDLTAAIATAKTALGKGEYDGMVDAAAMLKEELDDYYTANTETVTLTADMFYNWDGFGADAKKTAKANVDFNIGNDLQSGNVVVGNSEVLSAVYADLTGSFKLQFEGTAGITLRLLFNRQGDEKDDNNQNLTPPDEIRCTIGSDGTAEVFLPSYYKNKFIHLNGIKIDWGNNGTVSSIKIVRFPLSIDPNEYLLDTDFASLANWTAYTSNGFNDKGNGNIGTYRVKDGEFSPAATVDDSHLSTEYCLGLEARWSSNFVSYYQETTVALPEGVYTLTYDVENVNAKTKEAVYGNLFYVQVGDTKYTDESTEWMRGKSSWTTHTIQFPIEEPAKATVSLGYGLGDNNFAQEDSPVLYVSHLNLTYKSFEEIAAEELAAAKDALQEEINAADLLKDNKYYTGGKDQFVADLTTAQGALEAAVIDDVNAAIDNLKQAEQTYIAANMDGQFDGETGKYILVNVATSKSWGAGNSWGTQASLVEHPEYVTLNKQDNGTYQIESQVSNGGIAYYFNGDFMDNDTPVSLTITKIKEPLGYVDDNETLPYYAYIIANGNNVFGYDGETTVLGKNLDIRSEVGFERAMWVVVSLDDAKAQLSNATKEDPVDATFLLADPNFGRNNRNVAMWYGTFEVGGNNINNNAQSYMKMFDVSQTLTEIPNGMYKVGAQASVTFHDNRTIKEYDGNGYPVIFANDITANFFEMQTDDKLTNQSRLSEQFSAGVYQIEPILVKVTDGTLTLGAKSDRADIWAVWDNFQLTYLGLVPEAPVFSPGSTSFVESLSVELNCVTEGAKIYYTTDGTNPTAESNEYTEPIVISDATTIKAIAVKNGFESEVADATYTIAQGSSINLAITKLNPTTSPYDLSSGKSNPLHLIVNNNGDAPTNDFIVKYYKNDDVEPFRTVDWKNPEENLSPIAAGRGQLLDIKLEEYIKTPGEYTLRAELVSDNDISPDDNVFDSSVTIYMLGDANVNGEVTTSDAVATVSYILKLLVPDKVQKLSADVEKSNTITVSDAVGIVNIAMSVEPEAEARGEEPAVNYLTMENKEIGLVNSTGFSAFQMDVTLSDGTMLGGARQTERTAGMLLKTNKIGSNTWRIVALSLDGSAISGSEGSLLSLDIVGQGSVSVSNVEFADRAARAYKLSFGTPTAVNSLYNNKVDGEVYTVSGARSNGVKKGVNVVRQADGKVRKVLVK